MKEQLVDDDLVRRFLLGQVSAQEEDEIAALMFEDPEKFSQLESVEDDLIDEFLEDELSPADKEGFETHFLSQPGRRHNLKLSRALHQHFEQEDVPAVVPVVPVVPPDNRISVFGLFKISRPALQFSLAAAILILVVVAVWLYVRNRQSQQPQPFEAHKEQGATPAPTSVPSIEPSPSLAQGENKNSVPSPQKHEPAPVQAAVLMPLTVTRSEAQSLELPARSTNVFVELPLIDQTRYNSYDATLKSDDGTVLKSWPRLTAKRLKTGRGLLINIPLALLKPQELYHITVSGKSADGTSHEVHSYDFQPSKTP